MTQTAMPQIVTLTDRAAARVKELIDQSDKPVQGLRVGVKNQGCSGMMYFVEYAEEKQQFEDVIEDKGVKIFIAPTATMFLLGSEMDWIEDKFNSRFEFNNPNEADRCGCGESFSIQPAS